MLPPVELEILECLNAEDGSMRAGEIAALIDVTHQLVGHRTSKLREIGLVRKTMIENVNQSIITDKARQRYFGDAGRIQLSVGKERPNAD